VVCACAALGLFPCLIYPPSALRLHALLILLPALRQHPLGEVEALLRLTQLLAQSGEIFFKHAHPLIVRSLDRRLLVASVTTLLQPLRPQTECYGERAMRHGMPRLIRSKRNGNDIADGENGRDGIPDRWFESHGVFEPDAPGRYEVSSCGVPYTP
jgi:hypothetical protein